MTDPSGAQGKALFEGKLLYEGKAKAVHATGRADQVILRFKDDATAFNGKKHAVIRDKGRINCHISETLFQLIQAEGGVPHHMIRRVDPIRLLCHAVEIVPVEVVVRNRVAGSLAARYGLTAGEALPEPLVEWFYKSDALNDPLMGDDLPVILGWARRWELQYMREAALQINEVLLDFWGHYGIDLIDFKLEFGRQGGRLLLADELTPDGARLWERESGRSLDKDVFRKDLADLGETYRELHRRLFGGA